MVSDKLQEELVTLLGRCVNAIRELETENAELKACREWVGLTEEEVDGFWVSQPTMSRFVGAIEAALKEKNHGI